MTRRYGNGIDVGKDSLDGPLTVTQHYPSYNPSRAIIRILANPSLLFRTLFVMDGVFTIEQMTGKFLLIC